MRNIEKTEKAHIKNAINKNKERLFNPKIKDPLDTVIKILDDPNAEHKRTIFPYVPPQVQTPEEIETRTKIIDDEFTDLKTKFDEVNDVATDQKKQQKITDLIDHIIDEKLFDDLDDMWWEDDLFYKNDTKETVEISKDILKEISQKDPFIDFKIPTEQVISDIFDNGNESSNNEVIIEDVTDEENATDEEADDEIEEIETTSAYVLWDPKTTSVLADKRPRIKLSTDYDRKVKVANKIKNKYRRKVLRNKKPDKNLIEKRKKTSQDWLKTAGYLNTEDQNSINYIFVPPKKTTQNNVPADADIFIRSEIYSTELKKQILQQK